jgi:hypothetical protein
MHELVLWEMTALPQKFVFHVHSELRVCVLHKCHFSFNAQAIRTLISESRPFLTVLGVGDCPHLSATDVQDIFCRQELSELKAVSISMQRDMMFSHIMEIVHHNKRLDVLCVTDCNPSMYGAIINDNNEGCDFRTCVCMLQKERAGLKVFDDTCCMEYFREYLPPRNYGVDCRCGINKICACQY